MGYSFKDTGGPVFPCEDSEKRYAGMSIKDLFSVVALHALIQQYDIGTSNEVFALRAKQLAEALMKELEGK